MLYRVRREAASVFCTNFAGRLRRCGFYPSLGSRSESDLAGRRGKAAPCGVSLEMEAGDGEVIPPTRGLAIGSPDDAERTALAERIRAEHDAGERSLKDAVAHFRKCGDMLIEAKAGLRHGLFQFFLELVARIKPRTAQVYMQLARRMAELPPEKRSAVARLSLRDAIGELSRTSSRAAKLSPPALDSALAEACSEPLKQAVIKAANAKHYVSTPAPQVIERPPTRAPAQPEPLPMPPHVASLMRALQRTIGVGVKTYPDMDADDACWALNEVYCAIQDGGLSVVAGAAS